MPPLPGYRGKTKLRQVGQGAEDITTRQGFPGIRVKKQETKILVCEATGSANLPVWPKGQNFREDEGRETVKVQCAGEEESLIRASQVSVSNEAVSTPCQPPSQTTFSLCHGSECPQVTIAQTQLASVTSS